MTDRIKVLIVDDIPETRDHLSKLLGFESDVEVVGAAAGGPEAIEMATALRPDVVLMDINMPGMDGITATEKLAAEVPTAAVIMMSVQGEADYLRRSMLAGAREFLVKPFSSDELTASIRQVWSREKDKASRYAPVVTARPRQTLRRQRRARLRRRGLQPQGRRRPHDDLGEPRRRGRPGRQEGRARRRVVPVRRRRRAAQPQPAQQVDRGSRRRAPGRRRGRVARHVHDHPLLRRPGPPGPAVAGAGRADRPGGGQEGPRGASRSDFDLVVVDCPSSFNESTLAVLDEADLILTLLTLEITSVKNMRLFLEVCEQLGYGPEKIRLVLNRADSTLGIRVADVEHSIGRKVDHTIVSDGRSVVYALNRGVPFFLSNREAQVSQDIQRLADGGHRPAAHDGGRPSPATRPPRRRPSTSHSSRSGK